MSLPEESSVSQPGKKLEKSLDAIAALRKAMEERLAEAKAAQIAAQASEAQAAEAQATADAQDARQVQERIADELKKLAENAQATDPVPLDEDAPVAAPLPTENEANALRQAMDAEIAIRLAAAKAEQSKAEALVAQELQAAAAAEQAKMAREAADTIAAEQEMKAIAAQAAADEAAAAQDAEAAKQKLAEETALREEEAAQAARQEAEKILARRLAQEQAAQTPSSSDGEAPVRSSEAENNETTAASTAAAPQTETPQTNAKPETAQEAPQPTASTKTAEETTQETELHFDVVEWTQIMMHVSEESQKLIRDYIIRTRDKPIDTLTISPNPMMDSFTRLTSRFLEDPEAYTDAQLATWQNFIDLTRATVMRMQGQATEPVAEAAPNDKRFKAKDWQTNWMFDFLKQAYLSTTDEARRLVQQEASNVEDKMAKKIEFYSRLFLDATAPNNFWMTNPEVLRATLESKGENLIKGFKNLLRDIESGNGLLRIRMSDYNAFELGKNIATTPGKVVFQNELMQLIQYAPSTPTVRSVPFLVIPPWINKYYILDLKEKNSFIKYLVDQGHTVFCISWINPTRKHALTQFEDYMSTGVLTAMREIKSRTGQPSVNIMGYCIGGTLLACTQAYLAGLSHKPENLPKINSATYFVTMIDFSQPGDLGVFIDEDQIRLLEDRMLRLGYMDGNSLMLTFNVLRSNDLIWPFVINNYMLGREPFPFDILYWNTDSTNLPAAMQSYYLRNMYLYNKLVEPNALKMKDVPLDLGEIDTPSFLLSTREDHIAPWRSTYAATHIYKGPVKFVLAGSGHIAGVVNPPASNKYGYWTNDNLTDDPDEWLKDATAHKGSWWPEWIKWLDQYAGDAIEPREVTHGIEDAPGTYVKIRAL